MSTTYASYQLPASAAKASYRGPLCECVPGLADAELRHERAREGLFWGSLCWLEPPPSSYLISLRPAPVAFSFPSTPSGGLIAECLPLNAFPQHPARQISGRFCKEAGVKKYQICNREEKGKQRSLPAEIGALWAELQNGASEQEVSSSGSDPPALY